MTPTIRILSEDDAIHHLDDLAEVLVNCVAGGAGVGFVLPFTLADAKVWWQQVLPAIGRGERVLLAAMDGKHLAGTVSLVLNTPLNQRHRADISKMLVHGTARKIGLGSALMLAAEDEARRHKRCLLTLDTVTGSAAERLYRRLGWQTAGSIPDYALSPHGTLDSTTIMWKAL